MSDPYPKSREELEQQNAELLAMVARLQASLGSAQSTIIARDAEIMQLRNPRPKPRVLDPAAEDSFQRPAFTGRRR